MKQINTQKQFETPTLRIVDYTAKDILTVSTSEPTEPTERPGVVTTPPDEFDD